MTLVLHLSGMSVPNDPAQNPHSRGTNLRALGISAMDPDSCDVPKKTRQHRTIQSDDCETHNCSEIRMYCTGTYKYTSGTNHVALAPNPALSTPYPTRGTHFAPLSVGTQTPFCPHTVVNHLPFKHIWNLLPLHLDARFTQVLVGAVGSFVGASEAEDDESSVDSSLESLESSSKVSSDVWGESSVSVSDSSFDGSTVGPAVGDVLLVDVGFTSP